MKLSQLLLLLGLGTLANGLLFPSISTKQLNFFTRSIKNAGEKNCKQISVKVLNSPILDVRDFQPDFC